MSAARLEKMIHRIAEQSGAQFVSMSHLLKDLPESKLYGIWNWGNDAHFTEVGNRKLAECLYRPVNELLDSRNRP